MKKVIISHSFPVSQEKMWEEILKVENLFYVTRWWVQFSNRHAFPHVWKKDQVIKARIKPFGLGRGSEYWITVTTVNPSQFIIQTEEEGMGIERWKHTMCVADIDGACWYVDLVEVEAGCLTNVFAAYVWCYYQWRHLRWRRLLRLKKYVL